VYVRLRDEFRGELRELRREFREWATVVNTNLIGVMALLASEGLGDAGAGSVASHITSSMGSSINHNYTCSVR
jgi:hypothetical protein